MPKEKKLIHDEKSLGWDLKPTKMYGVSIAYQQRGSHQGGPIHNFKNSIALFSSSEELSPSSLSLFIQPAKIDDNIRVKIIRAICFLAINELCYSNI